jgi:TM2 domain-containing membrane protein YozV
MGYQSTMQGEDLGGSSERTQRRILIETTIANERKSAGIAYLLWFFFGVFGGHNYYVGKPMLGAAQLFGYILALAMYFSDVGILAVLLYVALGISLILDLCFIPARINAQTERLRERLSDTMVWES